MLLHAELSENQKVSSASTEPSFLWAGESRRQEVTQNDPQPPAAKRHKPNFNSSVFGTSSYSFTVSFEEQDVDTIIPRQRTVSTCTVSGVRNERVAVVELERYITSSQQH